MSSTSFDTELDTGKQLNAWSEEFAADVRLLSHLLSLRTRPDDYASRDEMEPTLSRMASHLSQLECTIDYIRSRLNFQRMQNEQFQQLRLHVHARQQRIPQIRAQLPAELKPIFSKPPPLPPPTTNTAAATGDHTSKQRSLNRPLTTNDKQEDAQATVPTPTPSERIAVDDYHDDDDDRRPKNRTPSSVKPRVQTKAKGRPPNGRAQNTGKSSSAASKQQQTKKNVPPNVVVRPVSKDELDAAPQYVRGRMTVDKIAAVATRLSEIATSKYTLIKRPNSSLTPTELSQCMEFQQSDCDEAVGHRVLTDNDIKGFGNYRIDSTVKTAINIMRHVGILKEVRGKNNVRILIINED